MLLNLVRIVLFFKFLKFEFVCSLGVPLVGIAALVGDVSVVAVNLESLNFEGVGDPALLYGKLLVARVQQKQPTAISETDVTQRMGRNICDPKYKKNKASFFQDYRKSSMLIGATGSA